MYLIKYWIYNCQIPAFSQQTDFIDVDFCYIHRVIITGRYHINNLEDFIGENN